MTEKDLAYKTYYLKIVEAISLDKFKNLSDTEVESLFSDLINCLPNNGKLYKYRNFLNRNHSFDNTYKALKDGYIWIADAKTMNDKVDVTLNVNLQSESIKLQTFFLKNKVRLLTLFIKEIFRVNRIQYNIAENKIEEIISCYTKQGRVIKSRIRVVLQSLGVPYNQLDNLLNQITSLVESKCVNYEDYAKDMAEKFIGIAYKSREDLKLFCLAEKPTIESMWAYYGNESNGFCIEYDLNKAIKYGCNIKKILLTLFKVEYKKRKPLYSMVNMIEEIISSDGFNPNNKLQINQNIFQQMLTKNTDWKHEQEWRIVGNFPFNILNIDIVSALYIDESMIFTPKGKKLIRLARLKGWKVIQRCLSATKSSFIYKEI